MDITAAEVLSQKRRTPQTLTAEEFKIVRLWLQRKVTDTQIGNALKFSGRNSRHWIAGKLRLAYERGRIKVK